jgi:putative flavoprotein involved in K+ transport
VTERHEVVVVGGGQAGLAISHCLGERGVEHVVLEQHRVGHSWRSERWDSFCLVTPNWQCRLPGHAYTGADPHGFMKKDEIVRYVTDYAARYSAPVREGVAVEALTETSEGFRLDTSSGELVAAQVVVATGAYHTPLIPESAATLPASIVSLHSSNYRNPDALPPGEVLVVGSGQSGCQIAEDLQLAGRKVHLAVGNAPRCARRYRGRGVVEWLDAMGYYDVPIEQHPNREQVRDKTNHYVTGRDGGRDIDLRRFALEGMKLYGPFGAADGAHLRFTGGLRANLDAADDVYRSINRTIDAYIEKAGIAAPLDGTYVPVWEPEAEVLELDLAAANVTSVIWSIGFRSDFAWVKVPVFDGRGYPVHTRGVTSKQGLYFIGLPWLHTWGSGRFSGVGRDAKHLVEQICAARARSARPNERLHAEQRSIRSGVQQ